MLLKTCKLINCPCYPFSSEDEAKNVILELISNKTGGYTVAINALKIVTYNRDARTKAIIDNAVLQSPDGFGAVFGMKLLHKKNVIKLDLPGLVLNIANDNKLAVFFLGTNEENNKLAVDNVKTLYPDIRITGRNNGFFKDILEIENKLMAHKPQIVMIAMGSPKQEMISAQLFKIFPEIVFVGCGGRLDILAGKLNRAPDLFIKWNIEWLYRLIKEPKRIKQQLDLVTYLFMLYRFHWLNRND